MDPSIPAPPIAPTISIKPIDGAPSSAPAAPVAHVLSVPPGTTISAEAPPPSLAAQAIAVLPDVAAIVVLGWLARVHVLTATELGGLVSAVLALRVRPLPLGKQATSAIATLAVGAFGLKLPPPPPDPPRNE